MRAQHVIALSGPPPLVIVRAVTMQQSKQHFFLRPTAIPLEQKLTQNPPESPLRALLAHTKSPNSLIYARKKSVI